LLSLTEALPTAQESLLWLEDQVSALAESIGKVETAVANALNKATDNAVAEALQDFADIILDGLPFGLGDRFRGVLEDLVGLVTSVDDLLEGVNTNLLEPLRVNWFSPEDSEGVGAALVDPLIENILDPLEAHLVNLSVVSKNWQDKLMAPTEEAIAQRAKLRDEIARYKQEHDFS
jgi:hypothetical protein